MTIDLASRTHFLGVQLQKLLHWVLAVMTTVLQTIQAKSFSVKINFVQARSRLEIFLFVHCVLLKRSLKSTGTDGARSAFPLTCTTASWHPNLPQFPSPQPSHLQLHFRGNSLPFPISQKAWFVLEVSWVSGRKKSQPQENYIKCWWIAIFWYQQLHILTLLCESSFTSSIPHEGFHPAH